MATKTYYAKLDCRSNNALYEQTMNEEYYNLMDFLTYLSGSGLCTLVSWNSGSSAAGTGAFTTKTYWDGGNPFGIGAHTIWRFNTSSTRNWEWYMYLQHTSGSSFFNQAHNLPITQSWNLNNSVAALYNAGGPGARGTLLQAAVCVSGTTSFNPWNGTLSMGNSTAASPRWVSGSNDRYLYVLPRSNDFGGAHATQKANHHTFGGGLPNTAVTTRQHFFYDGDAIMYIHDRGDTGIYDLTYVGAFELRNSLTSSGIGNGRYGFCMISSTALALVEADTVPQACVIGTTDGQTGNSSGGTPSSLGGGAAVPIGAGISGSKGMIAISPGSTFYNKTYQPNSITGKYDQFPIYVGFSEAPNYALLGNLNSGLLKYVVGPEINQVTSDYRNAIFGGSTALANGKVIVPWTGSIAPGVGLSRTGSLYTWTYDYE